MDSLEIYEVKKLLELDVHIEAKKKSTLKALAKDLHVLRILRQVCGGTHPSKTCQREAAGIQPVRGVVAGAPMQTGKPHASGPRRGNYHPGTDPLRRSQRKINPPESTKGHRTKTATS